MAHGPGPGSSARIVVPGAGRHLDARLHRPAGSPRGSVVVGHPHPGHGGHMDHGVVRALAARAAAAGYVAVRYDLSGVRESPGDAADGEAHLLDLDAALAFAASEVPDVPRYGAGFSYGARLLLERLRRPAPPPLAGLLLLAPATRVPRSARDFGDLLLGRPLRDTALDERALDRLRRVDVPTTILVGEHDNVAPPAELVAAAGAPARVVTLPGVNHFFSRSVGGGPPALDLLEPALDRAIEAWASPLAPTPTPRRT